VEDHGNLMNRIIGISPPSVEEFFFSVNNNLLIPWPRPLDEEDNFGVEPDANRLYYHVV
jgi:hypothetical protein